MGEAEAGDRCQALAAVRGGLMGVRSSARLLGTRCCWAAGYAIVEGW